MAAESIEWQKRAKAAPEIYLKDKPEWRAEVPGFMLTMSGNICRASILRPLALPYIDFLLCFGFDLRLKAVQRVKEWVAHGFLGQLLSGCLFHHLFLFVSAAFWGFHSQNHRHKLETGYPYATLYSLHIFITNYELGPGDKHLIGLKALTQSFHWQFVMAAHLQRVLVTCHAHLNPGPTNLFVLACSEGKWTKFCRQSQK